MLLVWVNGQHSLKALISVARKSSKWITDEKEYMLVNYLSYLIEGFDWYRKLMSLPAFVNAAAYCTNIDLFTDEFIYYVPLNDVALVYLNSTWICRVILISCLRRSFYPFLWTTDNKSWLLDRTVKFDVVNIV